MKKGYQAVRVEIPTELYDRFKTQVKKDYKSISSFIRDHIVQYVKEKEEEERNNK